MTSVTNERLYSCVGAPDDFSQQTGSNYRIPIIFFQQVRDVHKQVNMSQATRVETLHVSIFGLKP